MGKKLLPLDLEAIEKFALQVKDKVSAFAISSYFSTRNPEHELKARDLILELTGLPAVCGHELSQELGSLRKGSDSFSQCPAHPYNKAVCEVHYFRYHETRD